MNEKKNNVWRGLQARSSEGKELFVVFSPSTVSGKPCVDMLIHGGLEDHAARVYLNLSVEQAQMVMKGLAMAIKEAAPEVVQ